MFQKLYAGDSLISGIRVRKMLSDIPQCRSSQQCIHDGMYDHICVRVSQKSLFIGYRNASQNQIPSLHQSVHIISQSYSHTLLAFPVRLLDERLNHSLRSEHITVPFTRFTATRFAMDYLVSLILIFIYLTKTAGKRRRLISHI